MAADSNLIDHLIDVACGEAEPSESLKESRGAVRCDHEGLIALVQTTPSGGKSIPTVVRCRDISPGGLCVISRYMLHEGHEGAVLMRRSNGELALIGIRVVHCSYIGDMEHRSGLQFVPLADAFCLEDFRDAQGHMPQLDRGRPAA